MNADFLLESRCWFGGGTAIVLTRGEYRRSLDLDFLCADTDGYRDIRNAVFDRGLAALFSGEVRQLRDIRSDAYGVRTLVEFEGLAVKFEIVREARVTLAGALSPDLQVPLLGTNDMFAEKLLANADRCFDRAVAYRDAIDLGRLVEANGGDMPLAAIEKAEAAYGQDIARKAAGVLNHVKNKSEIAYAAEALDMNARVAEAAIDAFRDAARRAWPDATIVKP
ncbi:hypothetical protein ABID16_002039 [Rhizobium aquaticum]|uniref:Nucleotidyltransferase AbiEii toxin of type IV toxin-antitoxin system n=1 Tax=Rhizobium aquaticum TaxID=1549636 RepID=A0ABV2IYY0_9HYPH